MGVFDNTIMTCFVWTSLLLLLLSFYNGEIIVEVSAEEKRSVHKSYIPDEVREQIERKIQEHVQKNIQKIPNPNPKLEQVQEVPPLHDEEDEKTEGIQQQKQPNDDPNLECKDLHLNIWECKEWAKLGECDKNPGYMHINCKKSCDLCRPNPSSTSSKPQKKATSPKRKRVEKCEDNHSSIVECMEWAWQGECDKNPEFMHLNCKKTCNLCETSANDNNKGSSSSSGELQLYNDDDDPECKDWLPTCTEWAEKGNERVDTLCNGHWSVNKGTWIMTGAYVVEFCPKACKTCDIHLDDRDITLGVGLPQSFPGMDNDKELKNLIKAKVAEVRAYVDSIENEEIRAVCKMSHPHCARFALSSDCIDQMDHPVMKYGCAAACQTCEQLIRNNGIFEAEHMWTNALRDWKDAKQKRDSSSSSSNNNKSRRKSVKKAIDVSSTETVV